jgi:hypothetical protein
MFPGKGTIMSIDMPATLDGEKTRSMPGAWVEPALAVLFAVSAVLFVSFVAVVSGLV